MKKLLTTNLLFVSVALLALTATALGAPVTYDGFEEYTAGSSINAASGGDGWFGFWTTNPLRDPEISVISGGLSYSAGEISISGGNQALQYVATEGSVNDAIISRRTPGLGDTIYMSFLYQTQNLPDGFEAADPFIQIGLNPTLTNPQMSVVDSHQLLTDPDRAAGWWLRAAGGGVGNDVHTGVTSPDNMTHLIVMKATRNVETGVYDNLELFINPTSLTESENVSYVNNASTGLSSFNNGGYFVVRKAYLDPGNTFTFDEIRVADTFTDVLSMPETDSTRITTADGNGADTFVHWYSTTPSPANCNMGGKANMEVKNAGSDTAGYLYRKSYIRFDVSDVDLSKLTEASFELTSSDANGLGQTFNVYGLNDGNAGEAWTEGNIDAFYNVVTDTDPSNDNWITWNNAPANGENNTINLSEATLLGTFGGDLAGRQVGISGTDLLNFLKADTDGLVTFIVTRETFDPVFTGTSNYFVTKEHTNEDLYPALVLGTGSTTPPIPGDANKDGKVDGSDVTILAGNWQTLTNATWGMGDFNGDGKVDGSDVTILAGNWQAGVDTSAASVPEPSTLLLLLVMVASLMIFRRR